MMMLRQPYHARNGRLPHLFFFIFPEIVVSAARFAITSLQMTTDQRDYFSIKSGFGQKKPIEHEDNLFNSLNEKKLAWQQGLGDEVIHWLEKYKSALSAQALQERDHHGDLSQIIGMILDQL